MWPTGAPSHLLCQQLIMVSTAHAGLLQNGMGFEKTRPGGNPEREDSETIVTDQSGHVQNSSGAVFDTNEAAQIRPSRLTGYGLTFMVSPSS